MPHIIKLPLRTFALVKHANRGQLNVPMSLRWVEQIRGLRNVATETVPTAVEMAELVIEYGCNLGQSNIWEAMWDGTHLFKTYRNKKFILQIDELHVDERENLHHDSKPAFVSGEDKVHFLHGLFLDPTQVQWLNTPPEQLDPQAILAITNVDLRREMIRKKGIEQVLEGLFHRTIDKQGNYELIQVMLGDNVFSACNFLKMLNPSIRVWHMEGVPNNIRTIRDALLWRNNGWFENADVLT